MSSRWMSNWYVFRYKIGEEYITALRLRVFTGLQSSRGEMSQCDHCGAHVSDRFARVFADEFGQVFACPSCSANAGIAEAARDRTRS